MSCGLEGVVARSRWEFEMLEGEVQSLPDPVWVDDFSTEEAFHAAARALMDSPPVTYPISFHSNRYRDPASGRLTCTLWYTRRASTVDT